MPHDLGHHSARTVALTHRALILSKQCTELRERQVHLLTTLRARVADFRSRHSEAAATLGGQRHLPAPGAAGSVPPDAPPGPLRLDLASYRLTRREMEVAELLAAGHSNAAVARRLVISEHTARHHTESVLAKLGVRSRAEAGALVRGWYGAPPPAPQPAPQLRPA
jgi:DNA-binding CsgD family transcriptional regulator